jgi:transposase-like protein
MEIRCYICRLENLEKGKLAIEESTGNKRIRRTFDKEFKLSAVKLVVEQKQNVSILARDPGTASSTLQN